MTDRFTSQFLQDGQSKYGDSILYRPMPEQPDSFKFKLEDDGTLIIEGYASTNILDDGSDIVEPEAFRETLETYLRDPLMLYMHDWWATPVGKIIEAEIRSDGLWVRAQIVPTEKGKEMIELVKHGILHRFSIGFSIDKSETDEETKIRNISKLLLIRSHSFPTRT